MGTLAGKITDKASSVFFWGVERILPSFYSLVIASSHKNSGKECCKGSSQGRWSSPGNQNRKMSLMKLARIGCVMYFTSM